MIKRYNQFVNGRINENIGEGFDEEEGDFIPGEMAPGFDEEEGDFMEDEMSIEDEFMGEEEEEGGDIFKMKLKELADLLGTDVMDNNTIEYDGKTIIFPSETEMFHVDRKKFKTAQEAYDYLTGAPKMTAPKMEKEIERELELTESKSYRNTRSNKRRR
jgi:hypothetical protein